jgi:hypothetical protein
MQLVVLEVAMVEKDAVSKDFRKQVLGYVLTTAEIVYRRPDRYGCFKRMSGRTTICFRIFRR